MKADYCLWCGKENAGTICEKCARREANYMTLDYIYIESMEKFLGFSPPERKDNRFLVISGEVTI